MPVISAVANSALSTSEEKLPVNGSFQANIQTQSSSSLDEPIIFVFLEKQPGESLGLYLVPFEDEPLTGLFVKTIVPGKSADRLQVFDPGDKIVSVNDKPLRGLTYREATDFIRQCSGPNVKMGVIKHALYKKEDLARLENMSVFQRQSGAEFDGDFSAGGAFSLGQTSGADDLPAATRLSGSILQANLQGNAGAGGSTKEIVVDAPVVIQKSEVSYKLDFMDDGTSDDAGGFQLGGVNVEPNANMHGKVELRRDLPGSAGAVELGGKQNVEGDFSGRSDSRFKEYRITSPDESGGGTSGRVSRAKDDDDSGSETSDGEGGRVKRKLKLPKFRLKFGGGASGGAKGSKSDDSGSETSDGEGGRIKRKLKAPKVGVDVDVSGKAKGSKSDEDSSDDEEHKKKSKFRFPKFGFGSLKKSKDKSKKGKGVDVDISGGGKTGFDVPSVDLEGGIQKTPVSTELEHRPPSIGGSGSETSDGEGGRIKRKLKVPKVGVNIGGDFDGRGKVSKDSDSGSETSDGEGGRTKRKLKKPSFGIGIGGGGSGKVKGDKSDDESGSSTSDGEGGRIKRKLKKPKVGIEIGGGTSGRVRGDIDDDDSGSETSDGEGGRVKRKLKLPKFGLKFGGGASGGAKGSKSDDSGSETSDGEGGRIKRKLKTPKFGIRIGGGVSGKVKGDKSDDESASSTSDGEGGRICFCCC